MNNLDDNVGNFSNDLRSQATTEIVVANDSTVSITPTKDDSQVHRKNNDDKKEKENALPTEEETINVRLLGKPLVSHGPYTFYSAFAYREHGNVEQKKRQCKKGIDDSVTATKLSDPLSSCCCNNDNDMFSCHVDSSSSSLICSEWSVVHMNHFYAVRPWYNKQNSSDRQKLWRHHQKHSSKFTSTAVEHQSVCIAELELLWHDNGISTSNIMSPLSFKKRGRNRMMPTSLTTSNGESYRNDKIMSSNLNCGIVSSDNDDDDDDDDDDDERGNYANNNDSNPKKLLLLPHRRKRQPSVKKLEAAESFAATAASDHSLQHPSYRRSQLPAMMSLNSTSASVPLLSPSTQYKHGNILCSVRLYVMPDQTATGRLGGVHGEDEVLEINTWDNTSTEDGWPNNTFINGVSSGYSDRIDDYDNINGNHSTLPTNCSGLVLRVEDFVEWVRGGLMNDENENEDSKSSHESSESKCIDNSLNDRKIFKTEQLEEKNEQQSNLSPLSSSAKNEINQLQKLETSCDDKNKIKLESTVTENVLKKETLITVTLKTEDKSSLTIDMDNVKIEQKNVNSGKEKQKEHNNNSYFKSIIEKAVKMEHVSLAAALIHDDIQDGYVKNHCQHCRLNLVNYRNTATTKHNYFGHKLKESCVKQQLVIMSYSRYCRYRANLQRRRDERLNEEDNLDTTRVLFCRDTYNYPAELLLDPFNAQNLTQKNTAVLVNHMAPKLKGWPAHPASWMSFRWNRVRRRLRHLKRGNNDNSERRRRCRKLKKKCRRQNLAGGVMAVMSYSSSSSDDDSDSDGSSSATNDATTNTTTTTSDSDGARPSVITKITNKNHSVATMKLISDVHHNIKKTISVVPANNMVVINGANNISTDTINKRLSLIRQSSQQQPTKRRRVVYSTKNQQGTYQYSQQLNMQQQKMHSFDKQLSTSLSTIQLPVTKIVHLPPSISIRPVIVTNTNTSVQQQQIYDSPVPNKQKQHTTVVNSQSRNNNNGQQTFLPSPVVIEYDDNDNSSKQKFRSDNNGCFKKSPVATLVAACQKRVEYHDFEGDHRQQQYEQEKQRRWLVDALRLGGLEITAVPLNVSEHNSNGNGLDIGSTVTGNSQHQQRQKHCEVSFDSSPIKNKQNDNYNDSNLNENSDSVLMTVTPDVVCILNKSQQIQRSHYQQISSEDVSISTASGVSQQYRPVHLKNKNPALHEKINQAINSLKQQQSNTLTNNKNSNVIVMDRTNYQHINDNNNRRHRNEDIWQPSALLDLTVKSSSNTTRQQRCNVNKNLQEHRQIVSPFHSTATTKSAATNLEITIVPVPTSTTGNSSNNAVKNVMQQQQKLGSHNNSIGSSESSSMECQNAVSPLILNMLYSDKNKQNRQNSKPTVSSSSATINSSQQQLLIMATTDSQQNIKCKPQQNRKN